MVIAAGGGGIPTMYEKGTRRLVGVECVIDKDRATALLAREIGATRLRLRHRRRRGLSRLGQARAAGDPLRPRRTRMDAYAFPAGSMGPKVEAAQDFARATGGRAIICALADVPAAVRGEKGTTIAGGRRRDQVPLTRGVHATRCPTIRPTLGLPAAALLETVMHREEP